MGFLANATIDLTAIVAVFLLYMSGKRDRQTDFHQSIFDKMIICLICFLLVDLGAWYVDGKDFIYAHIVQMTLNSLVWLTQAVLSFLWLLYVEYWVDFTQRKTAKRIKIYAIPLFIEIGILVANVFTRWIFYMNDQRMYTHGTLYPHILIVFYGYGIYVKQKLRHAPLSHLRSCHRRRSKP